MEQAQVDGRGGSSVEAAGGDRCGIPREDVSEGRGCGAGFHDGKDVAQAVVGSGKSVKLLLVAEPFADCMPGYPQGEKEGHNLLGIMYRDGLGVPINIGSAKAYFQAAAQMELAEAKVHLGKFAGKHRLK